MARTSGWRLRVAAALFVTTAAGVAALAQPAAPPASAPATPEWAYAVPPAQPRPATPAAGAAPPPADTTLHSLPGTSRQFTVDQIRGRRPAGSTAQVGPADWYPEDHPAMPPIVAYGDPARSITACALCHYPNGKGKPENAPVSGFAKEYIAQQLHDMKAGLRKSAEPRKGNANLMVNIAKAMTEEEIQASAAYFASIPWSPWIRVVESRTAPKVRSAAGLYMPLEGADAGLEPIGDRIVEVPVEPHRTELLRDPRSGFIAYVPMGAVAKGKRLVETGGGGRTVACRVCHGADLNGSAMVPGLAGRSPSYLARQLNDFRQGARKGPLSPLMHGAVERLTDGDIVSVTAYLASLPAPTRTAALTR
jgi:cytochrome c553